MGLYLFKEVRATPADAEGARPTTKTSAPVPDEPATKVEPGKTVAARNPTPPPPPPPPTRAPPPPVSDDSGSGELNVTEELARPNPRLDAVMSEANKAYDHGEFDDAKAIALKVLAKDPTSVRMMRIVISAACIDGDGAEAQKHYLNLPVGDREQMKVRCARYGISFNDK
jgi:hypothetical protein